MFLSISQVPNAPCGVESLKLLLFFKASLIVPNAPCGVERRAEKLMKPFFIFVPNAPCGVESFGKEFRKCGDQLFLMHRVELKDKARAHLPPSQGPVPNAPCGVERLALQILCAWDVPCS